MNKKNICALMLVAAAWVIPAGVVSAQPSVPGAPESVVSAPVSDAVSRGLHLYYQGDLPAAAVLFSVAIQADPDDIGARYYLGYTHYRMGEFARSRSDFQAAYDRDPDFTPVVPASASDPASR